MPTSERHQPPSGAKPGLDSSSVAIAVCLLVGLALTAFACFHFVSEDKERLKERMARGTQTLATWSAANPAPASYHRTVVQLDTIQQLVLDGTAPSPELLESLTQRATAGEVGNSLYYLPRVQPDAAGNGYRMQDHRGDHQPFPLEVQDYLGDESRPAAPAEEYFPILFGAEYSAIPVHNEAGFSHFADPQFHLLMNQARDGGHITTRTAFPLLTLVQPYVVTRSFIALYTPGPLPATIAERRQRHTGFVTAVAYTSADNFINLIPESYLGFETAFIPHSEAWYPDTMDAIDRDILASGDFALESFERGSAPIHITTRPSQDLVNAMITPQRWWALSIGLLLTIWICSLLYMSRLRSRHLTQLVDERTLDLAERSQRLSESELRYRMVADAVQDVIFTTDITGRCTWISPSIVQHSGLPLTNYLGEYAHRYFAPESIALYREAMDALLADAATGNGSPAPKTIEVYIPLPDGRRKTNEITLSLIHDPDTGTPAFLGVGRDISERKQAEAERASLEAAFHRAQKLEAIGTLAGGVAHDFNNLLTGILGHAELLKNVPGSPQDIAASAGVIETAALRARELTSQLLGYARKGHYQSVPVNLQDVMNETSNLIQRTLDKNIRIEVERPESPLHVRGDPGQLHQVLLNLAVNARDAMPLGGVLSIRLVPEIISEPLLLAQEERLAPGRYCRIEVRDTGRGITAEHLPRIFDPFFTDKPEGQGTGLGLAMVHGVTRNHGGGVSVQSIPGSGATFRVYLPLIAAPDEPAAVPVAQAPSAGQGHVLLIDDEAQIRELGALMLKRLGYSSELAENGITGVECYRRRQAPIDLVIVDMSMPVMGGAECVQQLIQLDPSVRLILATGYSQRDLGDLLSIPNVRGFLQKPFMLKELADLLEHSVA